MILFETQSRMTLAELQVPRVKYVVWSGDYSHVALLSKHGEYIFLSSAAELLFSANLWAMQVLSSAIGSLSSRVPLPKRFA